MKVRTFPRDTLLRASPVAYRERQHTQRAALRGLIGRALIYADFPGQAAGSPDMGIWIAA